MTKSYVFVKISPGKESQVLQSFNEIEEVKHAQLLFGEHDVGAEISVEKHEDLKRVLFDKIRAIGGIERTKAYFTLTS